VNVPAAEIERRVSGFQEGLRREGLDAAIVVESSDLYYLTGTVQDAHLVVPAEGEPVYFVRRDLGRAREESPLTRVEPLRSLRELPAAIRDAAGDVRRLGLELDVVPAASYLRYRSLLEGVELADCMPAIRPLRMVKSAWELDRMRAAAVQLGTAFAAAPGVLRDGITDRELQIELEGVLRRNGHQGTVRFRGLNGEVFYGAVLAGADAAVPAASDTPLGGYGPSPAIGRGARGGLLEPGVAVTVDLVGAVHGYLADATRTFWLGELPEPLATALEVCRAILADVEGELVAGNAWKRPYERGLEMAEAAGFGDGYMGAGPSRVTFIGHGVGLEMNEPPFLARGLEQPLAAGNVVAVEPKLVFPGIGAVGVENTYAIRPDGPPERLTAFP
jgi:Xaa-Pro dipeptidase